MTPVYVSSAGADIRRAPLWRYIGTLLVLAATTSVLALVYGPRPDTTLALVGAVALGVSSVAYFTATLKPDTNQFAAEEMVVAAVLLAAPDSFPVMVILSPVTISVARRFLAPLARIRRSSVEKRLFNPAATVLSGHAAWLGATTAADLGAAGYTSAFVGSLTYSVVTGLLVFGAIHATTGDRTAVRERLSAIFQTSLGPGTGMALLGVGVGLVAAESFVGPVILASVIVAYIVSRARVAASVQLETDRHLLGTARALIDPDLDVDAVITATARSVFTAESAEIVPDRPEPGVLATPILAPDGGEPEWLVVRDRLALGHRFEIEDRTALRRLAEMTGPARQHHHLVDELRRAEASRGAIAGALAHDLRGLMGVVSTGAATIVEHGPELPPDTLRQVAARTSAGADRAVRILNDLLDLEQLSIESVTCEPGELREVASSLAAWYGDDLEVVVGPSVSVALDRRLLERAADNLIANARKHAPLEPPTLRWAVEDDRVRVVVEDRGPGIPEGLRDELTGPFRQRDATIAGVGLGLYLARRFAELAGGWLEIADRDGGGASMQLVLPLASEAGDPAPE